jgi:hypothetical protein
MIYKRLLSKIAQRKLIISTADCTLTVLSPDLLSPVVSVAYAALGDLISC